MPKTPLKNKTPKKKSPKKKTPKKKTPKEGIPVAAAKKGFNDWMGSPGRAHTGIRFNTSLGRRWIVDYGKGKKRVPVSGGTGPLSAAALRDLWEKARGIVDVSEFPFLEEVELSADEVTNGLENCGFKVRDNPNDPSAIEIYDDGGARLGGPLAKDSLTFKVVAEKALTSSRVATEKQARAFCESFNKGAGAGCPNIELSVLGFDEPDEGAAQDGEPTGGFPEAFNDYVAKKWGDGRYRCASDDRGRWTVEHDDGEEIVSGQGVVSDADVTAIFRAIGAPLDFPWQGELEIDRLSLEAGFGNTGYGCRESDDGELQVFNRDGGRVASWGQEERPTLGEVAQVAVKLLGGDAEDKSKEVMQFCHDFNEGARSAGEEDLKLTVEAVQEAGTSEEPDPARPGEDPDEPGTGTEGKTGTEGNTGTEGETGGGI